MSHFSRRQAVVVFLAFALAYFFSALIRAITATLSPTLSAEFNLQARDLGLLAGGYFLGFAAMQLPLGSWLDRYGPKRVIVAFLCMAVAGCFAFAWATSFPGLLIARVMCGIGVSACLMAPLTGYRRWLSPSNQLRANSWMLMTGSLGMVASTLPVQWLLPVYGWRPLFIGLAALVLVSIVVIAWQVPAWKLNTSPDETQSSKKRYAQIWRHPYFRRMAPIGFFVYGGLLAIQTLWAAPWMIKVAGFSAIQAATGMFWINVAMLSTFWLWGLVNPRLARRGLSADRLMAWGVPLSFLMLGVLLGAGSDLGKYTGLLWMLYCMGCSFVSLAQPAVGMAFPPELAGRALSAYNLVIFSGVFVMQWGIGLLIDAFKSYGVSEVNAFRGALGFFLFCCILSYLYFLLSKSHNQDHKTP
jgi:predicted MFS family arabinose efflux permease